MPYLLGLFHWDMRMAGKFGAMSKREGCKIDRIVWKMHNTMFCAFFYRRTHCPFIVPKSSETKDQAEFQIVVQFLNINV